ncbi:secreted protein [Streptomyces clavuligerus]|nr:secreted protein [Streptomyces clavuligerus]
MPGTGHLPPVHPQTPAPAPGPAYPQAPVPPPGTPYGQSPYGQPPYGGQQPYGQPGPGPQGPYGPVPTGVVAYGGAPQQPYPCTPAPPAPDTTGGHRRKGLRGRPGAVLAAGLAVLLLVGGGGYLALSGDKETAPEQRESQAEEQQEQQEQEGKEETEEKEEKGENGERAGGSGRSADDALNAGREDGEAKVSFVTKNDVDLPRNGVDAFGPWTAGDTVVRAVHRQITGYSTADGRKKWTLPVGTDICSATFNASADGKVVIGVKDGTGERAKCLDLRMVDIRTGTVGWKKTLRTGSGFRSLTEFTLTISGDTLGAAGLGNSFGLSLRDGRPLFEGPATGCKPFAFAGGPRLLAAVSCPTKDWKKPRQQLQELDAATGRVKWTYSAPEGWEVEKVFSADPVVVSLKQSREKKWGVVALTDRGTERSRIQGGKDRFQPRCGGNFVVLGEHLEGCAGVAADDDAFYIATQPERPGGANEVVAFDLDSGRETWRTPSGGGSTLLPLRMEGTDVLAYREPTYDRGGALTVIPPGGGAPRTLLRLQAATARTESSLYSPRLVYGGGTLFIASGRVSARDDAEELRTPTMMAFTR